MTEAPMLFSQILRTKQYSAIQVLDESFVRPIHFNSIRRIVKRSVHFNSIRRIVKRSIKSFEKVNSSQLFYFP